MNLRGRIDRLEAGSGVGDGWAPFVEPKMEDDWLANLFIRYGCHGYRSFGDVPASDLLGVATSLAMQAEFKEAVRELEASHEWRWVGGRCEWREKR